MILSEAKYFSEAKENMIFGQLIPLGIDDVIIDAMSSIDRQDFVYTSWKKLSYTDGAILIKKGNVDRYMLPSVVLAKMLQESGISRNNSVLDLACGTGYSSFIISSIASHVLATDNDTEVLKKLTENIKKYSFEKKISVSTLENIKSTVRPQKFDIIFSGCILNKIPELFWNMIKPYGKMIFLEVVKNYTVAVMYSLNKQKLTRKELFVADADKRFEINI